jgi:hypothetical protein
VTATLLTGHCVASSRLEPIIGTAEGPSPAPTKTCSVPRRAVKEVPPPQPPFLAVADDDALSTQHQEVLLYRLTAIAGGFRTGLQRLVT